MGKKGGAAKAWALCAGWMTLIFLMSAAPGDVSGEHSGLIVRLILRLLPGMQNHAQTVSLLVRKGAHMTEYAVLFLLYLRALKRSGKGKAAPAAFLLSVLYAATDELHQMFVPGRGPAALDVLIDSAGAALAWAAAAFAAAAAKRADKADA